MTPPTRLRAVRREFDEPLENERPFPTGLVLVWMAFVGWGGWYLGTWSESFRADVHDLGGSRLAAVAAPTPVDPLVLGARVYRNCAACHQANGNGLPGAFPPLAGSPRVVGPPEVYAALLLAGMEGPLERNGARYNGNMPSWHTLPDEELAAVMTWTRVQWGNQADAVPVALVASARAEHSARRVPWREEQLDAFLATLASHEIDGSDSSPRPAQDPATGPPDEPPAPTPP